MSVATEVRLGRNFLRAGDPCRVKGQGVFIFQSIERSPNGNEYGVFVGGKQTSEGPKILTRCFTIDERVVRLRKTPTWLHCALMEIDAVSANAKKGRRK